MVIVIQRMVQTIPAGRWDEYEELDKKFDEIEKKMGYPLKKRLRCLFGAVGSNSIVIEFEWSSLSKMEKTMTKAYLDPEYQKLLEKLQTIILSVTSEIYTPIINIQDLQG